MRSIVISLSDLEANSCGYYVSEEALREVENQRKSVSFGVWGNVLRIVDYQRLLDCGWRRLNVTKYKPSRTQKRVLRTVYDYLKNGTKPKRGVCENEAAHSMRPSKNSKSPDTSTKDQPAEKKEKLNDSSLPQKKKTIRRARAIARWQAKGFNVEEMQAKRRQKEEARVKMFESFFPEWDDTWAHKLTIHKEQRVRFSSYKSFLIDTPLTDDNDDGIRPELGSHHRHFRIDGKLIAVAIFDLLPNCYSSKYLFYDPEYAFLSLGTFTALSEIYAVRHELMPSRPELKYYYMGYYLDDCPKMCYKGKFAPSELLCDRTLKWRDLEECRSMIRANGGKFTVFFPDDPEAPSEDVENASVAYKLQAERYITCTSLAELRRDPRVSNIRECESNVLNWTKRVRPSLGTMTLFMHDVMR